MSATYQPHFPPPYQPPAPAKKKRGRIHWAFLIPAFLVGLVFGSLPGGSSSSGTAPATVDAGGVAVEQPSGPISLGAAVNVDGLVVNVTEIVARADVGQRLTCANVSYSNQSGDVADRGPSDWSARNAQGASVGTWLYTNDDALDYGELARGGTDSGIVCFDVPRDEVAVIEYKSNMFHDGPDAEWATR